MRPAITAAVAASALAAALAAALAVTAAPAAAAGKPTQFWNLTGNTIDTLRMSPAGKNSFGPNQCANDKDGTVDPDERLKLTGVATGAYDVRFTDKKHRTCEARNVAVKEGEVFSLSEKEITCGK